MDEYAIACIEYMRKNKLNDLASNVNTICNTQVDISQMSTQEIANTILEGLEDKPKEDNSQKSVRPCKHCGEKTVIYREVQARGADEGMSTIYRCTKCSE